MDSGSDQGQSREGGRLNNQPNNRHNNRHRKMTQTLTIKQETFCFAYVETGNASEAYRQAYDASGMKPATINRKAKALLDNEKIAAKIAELRAKAAARNEITVDDLVDELEYARNQAFGQGTPQVSAAVTATMGKAKLLGLISDKTEITGKHGGPIQIQHVKTDDEISDELAGLLCGLFGIDQQHQTDFRKVMDISLRTGIPMREIAAARDQG